MLKTFALTPGLNMFGNGYGGINLIMEGRGQADTEVQAFITIADISNHVKKYAIILVSAINWAILKEKMLPKCQPVVRRTASDKFNLNNKCDYVESFKILLMSEFINITKKIAD